MTKDQNPAIVIINRHEPEGEVAGRLLELAVEKGHNPSDVEAQRGEHDAALSFRVPQDVADSFNAERDDRWPSSKIENDDEKAAELAAAGVNGDAYAADAVRNAQVARAENAAADDELVDDDNDPNTPPVRKARPGKAKE